MTGDRDRVAEVVEQWRKAGPALAAVRRAELAALTDQQAMQAIEDLLGLWQILPPKQGPCGLVEQQRLFALARR